MYMFFKQVPDSCRRHLFDTSGSCNLFKVEISSLGEWILISNSGTRGSDGDQRDDTRGAGSNAADVRRKRAACKGPERSEKKNVLRAGDFNLCVSINCRYFSLGCFPVLV